jgi:peptidoglycan/xylan/chitin deacetylase (PgdA/CDA1 family)
MEPKCGVAPDEPASAPVTPPTTKYPEIRHWEVPPDNVVALTFDDGPNPSTTNKILDTLRAEKIRATFFINSRGTSDLRSDAAARETLRRIVAEGHVLGNHTASHYDLRSAKVNVEAELKFVEEDVKLAAPCAPPITLVRTPYGQPQLAGTEAEKARVLPILARHGVHIGWTIETLDYECNSAGPACVIDRVKKRLDLGKRGAILMHDTQPVTVVALPLLIKELRARGIGFVTAEKLVRDKFGKPSSELLVK